MSARAESLGEVSAATAVAPDPVPHVVAWNLTRRCNLECAHCYISAGPQQSGEGELGTEECLRIAAEILALNPNPMFIFSGGEPLLREDLGELASFASGRGATVVLGTNGTLLSEARIDELQAAGVTGVAVSVDSLNPRYHDRFRRGHGSLQETLEAVERLAEQRLDFVVQATLTRANRGELERMVSWAAERGAVSFNAYFLVSTGRGAGMDLLSAEDTEALLAELSDLHKRYLGTMMVRAKCAPQFMRVVHRRTPDSPVLNYATRCQCGVQYCRITPEGKLTPCAYMPVEAGDLREHRFEALWHGAEVFRKLRAGAVGGKCGRCGYRALCGGCRARAFSAAGDYLDEDPSCGYQPQGHEPVVDAGARTLYGDAVARELDWSADAEARISRVPSFARGVVIKRIEDYVRRNGGTQVTVEVMREVRAAMPVDFSKRLPFFLRER